MGKPVNDIIAQIPGLSRQRRYQLRHIKAGLCILCDEPDDGRTHFCSRHREMKAKYMEVVNARNRAAKKKAARLKIAAVQAPTT